MWQHGQTLKRHAECQSHTERPHSIWGSAYMKVCNLPIQRDRKQTGVSQGQGITDPWVWGFLFGPRQRSGVRQRQWLHTTADVLRDTNYTLQNGQLCVMWILPHPKGKTQQRSLAQYFPSLHHMCNIFSHLCHIPKATCSMTDLIFFFQLPTSFPPPYRPHSRQTCQWNPRFDCWLQYFLTNTKGNLYLSRLNTRLPWTM